VNRPGAGANIALQAAANSPPDGYTLVTITSSNTSNATLYESLPFNLQRDLIPIAALSRGALVLEVNPLVPVKTLDEFISYFKANAGKINVASFGVGTSSYLQGELFKGNGGDNPGACALSRRCTRADHRPRKRPTAAVASRLRKTLERRYGEVGQRNPGG
jgi:tripartite-type tricarboxylate transporter receptor subunit TctC